MTEAALDRNRRVQDRYDELTHIGKHGHYETLFQVVREEVERAALTPVAVPTDAVVERFAEALWQWVNEPKRMGLKWNDILDRYKEQWREGARLLLPLRAPVDAGNSGEWNAAIEAAKKVVSDRLEIVEKLRDGPLTESDDREVEAEQVTLENRFHELCALARPAAQGERK